MNKNLKTIFLHLDGIALSPIFEILSSYSIDQYLLSSSKFKMANIIDKYKANSGYFNILLKILESQGILEKNTSDNNIFVSDFGKEILTNSHLFNGTKNYYKEAIALINNNNYNQIAFEKTFNQLFNSYKSINNNNKSSQLVKTYIEGSLIAPIIIFQSFNNPASNLNDENLPTCIVDFLKDLGFLNNQRKISKKGDYFLSKCYAYAVPTSYMRTFYHLEDLLFGDFQSIWKKDSFNNEYHVNRALNVWGSGKSHKNYFKDIEIYIKKIFNKPLKDQPLGISDMGCGDGSFLLYLYNLIKKETIRGKNFNTNPIFLVGADYNQAALNKTIKTFEKIDITPITILADIAYPDIFYKNLKNITSFNLSNFLNVRAFLDHNRTYNSDINKKTYKYNNISDYSYCWKGKEISASEIQDDLVFHFKKWKKYIYKHGLLLIELHSTNINLTRSNLGLIPMISYISTHGFSDQFIVEHDAYKECLEKAGIEILKELEITYPNKELKMISIHIVK